MDLCDAEKIGFLHVHVQLSLHGHAVSPLSPPRKQYTHKEPIQVHCHILTGDNFHALSGNEQLDNFVS